MSLDRLAPWGIVLVLCAWGIVVTLMIRDAMVHDICGRWYPEIEARDAAPDERYVDREREKTRERRNAFGARGLTYCAKSGPAEGRLSVFVAQLPRCGADNLGDGWPVSDAWPDCSAGSGIKGTGWAMCICNQSGKWEAVHVWDVRVAHRGLDDRGEGGKK